MIPIEDLADVTLAIEDTDEDDEGSECDEDDEDDEDNEDNEDDEDDDDDKVIKVREVRVAKGVMAGDVSPVAMFCVLKNISKNIDVKGRGRGKYT